MAQMPNDVINGIYHDGYMAGYDEGRRAAIPRWIPVTERLPEDGQDILSVKSRGGEERIVPANYDRGVWYDCVFNYPTEHITHWMPLPEPPKEDVVPVVRCKDCRWHIDEEPGMVYCPKIVGGWVDNDWFCKGGERKNDEVE